MVDWADIIAAPQRYRPMVHVLPEPFRFAFLRHALVVCTITGALCDFSAGFVALRDMSYMSYIGARPLHPLFGRAAIGSDAAIGFIIVVVVFAAPAPAASSEPPDSTARPHRTRR